MEELEARARSLWAARRGAESACEAAPRGTPARVAASAAYVAADARWRSFWMGLEDATRHALRGDGG